MSQYVTKIRTNQGDKQIDYNALANLPTISNPNLLINGDFRNPINQRGQTSYTGHELKRYTIDRWCMGDSDYGRTVEIVAEGVKVINSNTSYPGTFQQIFEHTLPKGTYTLSVKVISKTGSGIFYCTGSHGSTKGNLVVGVNTLTLTDATINSVKIEVSPGSDFTLEWAKLEVGSVATQFSPKIYAEELEMCLRYYQTITKYRCMLGVVTSENAYCAIPLSTTMRTSPSVSVVESDYIDLDSRSHVAPENIGKDGAYTTDKVVTLLVKKNSASTFTAGQCLNCSVTARFDAEIY